MRKFLALAILAAATLTGSVARTDDKKDPFKLPDLTSKEWKELKDSGGIKIWDVTEGKGEACPKGAKVKIHYTGWLKDGTVFDSSKKDGGDPITFPLANLIQGWQEGVPGMKPGGTRRLMIPYDLAYGAAGKPPVIPAKADLVFEIELIEVK
ncbi:MAG: FKBP-type peptidyl-prolyl cis-trans isomerase [Gemmataceae bacterium]